jgi:hypothetical protein
MMSSMPRARGAKEPSGRTKAAILLFLARHGESTFTDVREYLLEKYNIRSAKDIRIHLADLSDDNKLGFIIKKPNGNGNACSYKVREGFNDLKRLFNYLKAQGAGPELMQTKIFLEFTSSKNFFKQVQLDVINNVLTDFCRCLERDEYIALLKDSMEHIPPEHKEVLTIWIERVRRLDKSDPLSRSFIDLIETFGYPDGEHLAEDQVQRMIRKGITEVGQDSLESLFSTIRIPGKYREQVTTIMRLSPSAFDCVINLNLSNPLFPPNLYMAYAISLLLSMDEEDISPIITVKECCEYTRNMPRAFQGPPILVIARSYFVTDLVTGHLTIKEVLEETLRLIFSE